MDDLEALTDRIAAVVAGYPVAFSYLFGSFARATTREGSDVDVAVRFEPQLDARQRFDQRLRLGVDLERALGRAVDVVDLDEAPLRLAGRILTQRRVVTGLASPERVRYETELYRPYVDFEYHARRMDAEVLAATARGER